ncbi:MAG: PDZ domain-containing protein [bacterium]|nr:PDZ domain-containing protein [bacterium]
MDTHRARRLTVALPLLLGLALAPAMADTAKAKSGGWMGILLGKPGSELAEAAREAGVSGVPVQFVVKGSPAAKAGLRARDIIVNFDGNNVESANELLALLRNEAPGNWVPFGVLRGDDDMDLRIRLVERPANPRELEMRRATIGVDAIDLPPALREHFGAQEDSGIMISEVEPGSPAEAAGFRLGDVVFEVAEQPIKSAHHFSYLVSGGGVGNTIEIKLARVGAEMILEPMLIVDESRSRN